MKIHKYLTFGIFSASILIISMGAIVLIKTSGPDQPAVLSPTVASRSPNGNAPNPLTQATPTLVTEEISASWAYSYGDLDSLKAAADVIVVGMVTSAKASSDVPSPKAANVLIFTDHQVTIDSVVLKGSSGLKAITVHQTGGQVGNVKFEVDDDPIFEAGATYLLFLKKDPRSDKYFVPGGPQGRLVVQNNEVESLSVQYPQRHISDFGMNSTPLDQVEAAVR